MAGVREKLAELGTPPTVTAVLTLPGVKPFGNDVTICVLLQLLGVATMPPKETVLVPWVAPKFVPLMVTVVDSGPEVGDSVMFATWVKDTPLLAWPRAVTTTLPVAGLPEIAPVMLVSLQLVGVIPKLFHCTVLVPWVAPKLLPLIVTAVPTGPALGETDCTTGAVLKNTPLLTAPAAVTTTLPEKPFDTGAVMLVLLQLVGAAVVPLNCSVLAPCVEPKLFPVIVTDVPITPTAGVKLTIAGLTVNETELPTLPTVTTTVAVPGCNPSGTGAVMLVLLQLVGVAGVPLKVTALEPCVAPKPVPVIVTDVPALPLEGEIVVFATTVKGALLLANPAVTTKLPLPGDTVGTRMTILSSLQLVGVAVVPFQATVPPPCVAPKLAPLMVTGAPTDALLSDSD
jgi:hypothetical protein